MGAGGSATSGFVAGGNAPPNTDATEEWSIPDATKTFTAS